MTYTIKNTSNESVIEPHFGVTVAAGETRDLEQDVAQRLLVIRPDAIVLVTTPAAPAPVEKPVEKPVKKADKE